MIAQYLAIINKKKGSKMDIKSMQKALAESDSDDSDSERRRKHKEKKRNHSHGRSKKRHESESGSGSEPKSKRKGQVLPSRSKGRHDSSSDEADCTPKAYGLIVCCTTLPLSFLLMV